MARDHDAELAEQIAMQARMDALLDRILDRLPGVESTGEEDLVLMLDGPFGVEWRRGREPHEAPPAAWEQVVLELGEDVAVGFHLDPVWAEDAAEHAEGGAL
jgi:hypothetical protein